MDIMDPMTPHNTPSTQAPIVDVDDVNAILPARSEKSQAVAAIAEISQQSSGGCVQTADNSGKDMPEIRASDEAARLSRPAGVSDPARVSDWVKTCPAVVDINGPGGVMAELDPLVPDDPQNPQNWPARYKIPIVGSLSISLLFTLMAGSAYYPTIDHFQNRYDVSADLATLGFTLFYLGLAVGSMLLAPLSEQLGRRGVFMFSYLIFVLFLVGTAIVDNLAGFYVVRILCGVAASVTIVTTAGVIADAYKSSSNGIAVSIFVLAVMLSLPAGNLLFSIIDDTKGRRTAAFAILAIAGGFSLITIFLLAESSHLTIKKRVVNKNENIRRKEGASAADSIAESTEIRKQIFLTTASRPYRFFSKEVALGLLAVYCGYLSGLMFLLNAAFLPIFGDDYSFNEIGTGLAYLGLIIGIFIGPFTYILGANLHRRYAKTEVKTLPENRFLSPWMYWTASLALPTGLFWVAWTTYISIHWIVPIVATALLGWSFYMLNVMAYNYVIDCYSIYSASAIAVIILFQNLAAAVCSFLGRLLFSNMDQHIGMTIVAALSVIVVPVPYIMKKYGMRLRKASPWVAARTNEADEPCVEHVDPAVPVTKNESLSEKVDRIMNGV